jgi:hypothetical protein
MLCLSCRALRLLRLSLLSGNLSTMKTNRECAWQLHRQLLAAFRWYPCAFQHNMSWTWLDCM